MRQETKPTNTPNPKDAIGVGKLPVHLVPSTLTAYASLAFLEGALKYGKYNWRIAGVRASIYLDAMQRHYDKYLNGEWCDPKTKVPHLASIVACCGIILDAHQCGMLTDDRPPIAPSVVDGLAGTVAHLKETFEDYNLHQYTIADTSRPEAASGCCLDYPKAPCSLCNGRGFMAEREPYTVHDLYSVTCEACNGSGEI